jgi:hypothetical protein
MSVAELIPALKQLDRTDKVLVMDFLANELTQPEGEFPFQLNSEYEIWSPYDTSEAATTLEKMLTTPKTDEPS